MLGVKTKENGVSSCLRIPDRLPVQLEDIVRVSKGDGFVHIVWYAMEKNSRKRQKIMLRSEEMSDALHLTVQRVLGRSRRRLLVITNPFSGQKKALELWEREALPILTEAGIHCEVVCTAHAGNATELARDCDLSKYDGILINSGDGLVSEVLTGLLLRKDKEDAIRMPIGHIPGGTSNALAAAICYACNEPFSPRHRFVREMALMAVSPRLLPLSLYMVETPSRGILPMFLTVNWGLIADIDIESERFRQLGMIRLHIEAVLRIAQLPSTCHFRGRISYLPVEDPSIIRKSMLRYNVDRDLFGPGHFSYPHIPQPEFPSRRPPDSFPSISASLSPHRRLLPPLSDPLPDGFTTIEGEFVFVCVNTLSHLGSDLPFTPCTRLHEDIMWLAMIDWRTLRSRLEVASLMITIESSRHLDYPCFQAIPVRAVRVVPLDGSGGNVVVDGEPCGKGEPFQCEPLPFTATVMGREHVNR